MKRNNKIFSNYNITEGRNTYHGVNSVSTHYNIWCDTYIVIVIFTILITPCDCIECRNAMYLPWYPYILPRDKPRYYSITKFKYYPISGEHNYLIIIYFIEKGTYEDEYK